MTIQSRSFFSFPALVIGIGIAIVFFKAYGPLTRPAVPTPVSRLIEQFAPGVALATKVSESTKKVSRLRWVDNVGYVGKPASPYFDEVRIVPEKPKNGPMVADRDAKVDHVEFVAYHPGMVESTMRDLVQTFGTQSYSEGCLEPVGDGYPYRQVRYWATKNDRGGAAVVNDWTTKVVSYRDTTPQPWSLMVWKGKFAGSSTVHGAYQPIPCLNLVGR